MITNNSTPKPMAFNTGILCHPRFQFRATMTRLLLALFGLLTAGQLQAADHSRWMTDNWNALKNKTLRQLVLPGSHDSGAYDLVNPWELFDGRYTDIGPGAASHLQFTAPDAADKIYNDDLAASGPFFEDWSQTQDRTLYEQLCDGIRSFDMRIAVDPAGEFRAVHSLYGDTLEIMLDDINRFSNENPGEFIFLRFDKFHDVGLRTPENIGGGRQKMRRSKHVELIEEIRAKLGPKLIPDWSPTMTLDQLVPSGSASRIALFYHVDGSVSSDSTGSTLGLEDNRAFYNTFVTTPSYAAADWVNPTSHKADPETFKNLTRAKIDGFRSSQSLHRLGAVTPTNEQFDAWYQGGSFAGTNPKTLKAYAEDTNPRIATWIRDEWANLDLNIIHMDFYPDYLVPLCMELNGISVPAYTIPESFDWGNYFTLEEIKDIALEEIEDWGETAVDDVEDWFTEAWDDVSTFFKDTANDFVDVFYETTFPTPLAGTAPTTPPVPGVRHYTVESEVIWALPLFGDGGDELEVYGQIFMVPSAFMTTDQDSNSVFWSRQESTAIELPTTLLPTFVDIPHTKNLYVPEAQAASAKLALGGALVENDDSLFPGGGDDFAEKSEEVDLGSMAEGDSILQSVTIDFGSLQAMAIRFRITRLTAPLIQEEASLSWHPSFPASVPNTARMGTNSLTATSSAAGDIVYSPPLGELMPLGQTIEVTATITPTDTRRYLPNRITRMVTVAGPDEETSTWPIEAGTISVTENPFSATLVGGKTDGTSIDAASTNSADIYLNLRASNSPNAGVLITSVAELDRDGTYVTSSTFNFGSGYGVSTHRIQAGAVEKNINTSFAWFPYSNWLGGIALNDSPGGGGPITSIKGMVESRIEIGNGFQELSEGVSEVDLRHRGASSQEGILLTNGAANDNNFAISEARSDGTFRIYNHDNATDGNTYERDPVSFVYLGQDDIGKGGLHAFARVNRNSTRDVEAGPFTITKGTAGVWYLEIPGHTPDTGVLLVTPAAESSPGWALDNMISSEWDPETNRWEIQSRDLKGTAAPTLQDSFSAEEDMFNFAFISTAPPLGGFDLWITENSLPDQDRSFDGDANGDGITNGYEYVFGTEPLVPFPPQSGDLPGTGRIPLPPSTPFDVVITLQWSVGLRSWGNLVTWEFGNDPVINYPDDTIIDIDQVVDQVVDGANPNLAFYRYVVSRP